MRFTQWLDALELTVILLFAVLLTISIIYWYGAVTLILVLLQAAVLGAMKLPKVKNWIKNNIKL